MHRRESSSSTVRASRRDAELSQEQVPEVGAWLKSIKATLWIHDDNFSTEEVLISPAIVGSSGIHDGSLLEIIPYAESTNVRDFEQDHTDEDGEVEGSISDFDLDDSNHTPESRCLCIAKLAPSDLVEKHPALEISMTRTIANAFGFNARSHVTLVAADPDRWTASHVELSFRDAYLARSDMWRLVHQELTGRTFYRGQKVSFLGSMKLTVKTIHVRGRKVSTAFFSKASIPIFRSEAARYVLFIQMSREMWDFDSEGNGEIMFNRVINGFLPDLFRRWVELEVRHLVSIVLFGRMEYDRYDFGDAHSVHGAVSQTSSASNLASGYVQDFYRVVVTDIASAQWTTILDELKKDFRVFLRDISMHVPEPIQTSSKLKALPPKITGRPSTALKGNILEAINVASSQFANDYIDRDLIRTGVSTIVITAGTGVFDVDRDLLSLTSENLTNNGIGIDVVCLSKMPLHSVPLFRYRLPHTNGLSRVDSNASTASQSVGHALGHPSLPSLSESPAFSSFTSASATYFSRFPSAFPSKLPQHYGYGMPQWIDLSYWSHETEIVSAKLQKHQKKQSNNRARPKKPFVPRVRMYELQMMGLMEIGMADIALPYLTETNQRRQRRQKHTQSDTAPLSSTKSLSRSPNHSRKTKVSSLRLREGPGLLASQAKSVGTVFESMDGYDEVVFRDINKPKKESKTPRSRNTPSRAGKAASATEKSSMPLKEQKKPASDSVTTVSRTSVPVRVKTAVETPATSPETRKASKPASARISRTISYALRGLAPPMRTAAVPEVNVENVKAQPLTAQASFAQAKVPALSSHSTRAESLRDAELDRQSQYSHDSDSHSVMSSGTTVEQPSKPISIAAVGPRPVKRPDAGKTRGLAQVTTADSSTTDLQQSSTGDSPSLSDRDHLSDIHLMPDSVPKSTLPFIRNVNASNPLKRHPKAASAFGRWQHLYPHKPKASTVKWRSLCTPASVPITTEDFPHPEEFESDYDAREHVVSVSPSHDALESHITTGVLLQEMIALRLAHGYQIVIRKSHAEEADDAINFLTEDVAPQDAVSMKHPLFMIMGSTIQKLALTDDHQILVTKYVKKTQTPQPVQRYTANIRTILGPEYKPRPILFQGASEEYPWPVADQYLANEDSSQDKVYELRFWRARFVLLPVEPPANAFRPTHPNTDDNEEEIHLLGIRALTQMWQKQRYFPLRERKVVHGRMNTVRRQDQNPLEIKFETLNPSEVIATELDKILALEESGEVQSTQLLPESEKLDREAPMARLAQAMQDERGIEIKHRRWHLRLHYNCFHGEEFTNWLLHNVKNMETRDEAVEFGNQLMKEGLFEHVNGRHRFRDGNYFYSLRPEFRTPRLDLKGSWFSGGRRGDKSMPPTPMTDTLSEKQTPLTVRSRSGSNLAFQLNSASPTDNAKPFPEKKRKTVSLSKMIRIDVDPRKRSSKPEIVDLHYDRLHNPENCYHIELCWLTATSKLVDEAITSWTTQAEKYGLKLVEVPIAEASKVPDSEPFRSPYRIKLAIDPPKRAAASHVFTTTSFSPQPNPVPDVHLYQKALLRRFNFVLDLEAASEYPENVEIQYSWGRHEYQYTQFIHRSGIGMAQITDKGDILLLANRLYNARSASSKDAAVKFDPKWAEASFPGRPAIIPPTVPVQASGIIGVNVQSPSLAAFSPQVRVSADVLGGMPKSATTLAQYITPEQIKDEMEGFCNDAKKLEQFYKEVTLAPPPSSSSSLAQTSKRPSGSTSSSLLGPVRESETAIPAFELPESVAAPTTSNPLGLGMGLSMLKRARGSVMYDSVAEILGGHRDKDREVGGHHHHHDPDAEAMHRANSEQKLAGLDSPKRKSTT